jgi:colanic acid/amylovoran biosynthesis glycosyltransferase
MKIAVVLVQYPKLSEPFIGSFISYFVNSHKVFLISKFNDNCDTYSHIKRIPYLNLKGLGLLDKLVIAFKIIFFLRRFIKLYNLNVPVKQLITDAGLITLSKIDILHFPFANLAFGREHYAKVMNAKMSISFRGSDINVYPIYHKLSYAQILENTDMIHCNSVELKDKLKIYNEDCLNKVTIIPSAIRNDYNIDTTLLNDVVERRDYSIERIITIGRLHWVKDYPLTLQVLGILKRDGVKFEYRIVGDGIEKEHLMFLIDFYNLKDCVFLLGSLNSSEIKKELLNSTLYLQTSLAEGFSNSCLEAQSQGLMCVVSNVSGMDACIENYKTGIVVADRKPESFVEAIKNVTAIDKSQRRKNEIYASGRVFKLFSQEIQRELWLNFFES